MMVSGLEVTSCSPENIQGKSTKIESMGNRTHQNWPPWQSEVWPGNVGHQAGM